MKELKQRYLLTKREFLLTQNGIRVISKTVNENLEYTVKYDELGFDIIKKREKTTIYPAILLTLFFLLDVYLLFDAIVNKESKGIILMWMGSAVFFGIIAGLAFYRTNKDEVYLTGGAKVLELLRDRPSVKEVDDFIKAIHNSMRTFYRNKYAVVDKHLPQNTQVERFRWLKENDIINHEEHEDLLTQLQNNYLL